MSYKTVALVILFGSCCTLSADTIDVSKVETDGSLQHKHSVHHSSINHSNDAISAKEDLRTTVLANDSSDVADPSAMHNDHEEFLKFVSENDTNHDSHVHHHHHDSMDHGMINDQGFVTTGNDLSKTDQSRKELLIRKDDAGDGSEDHNNMDHDGHGKDHDGHNKDQDGNGNGHDGHGDHMNKNESDMHGMKMWFHTGEDETILFKEWKVTNAWGMIGSMVGILMLGMFYEGLKYFREYLFKQYISSMQFATVAVTGESGRVTQVHKVEKHRMLSAAHAIQTCLHVVQIVISYFLMLIFMTYNVWLCLSVVLGAGLGYFIFGWKKATVVDITEHCH